MKVQKCVCVCLLFFIFFQNLVFGVDDSAKFESPYDCAAYCLVDAGSGASLLEKNCNEPLALASITKIMTMLILAEKVDSGEISLNDEVETSEHAKSMGGSKLFLEVGEKLTVGEMLTAIALPSANDAAVAVAEHIAGTESSFVELMNKKAQELNMNDTYFVDACGLDDNNCATATDVAKMARELILKHKWITKITSQYEVNLRNVVKYNTNKLVKFYDGCNGLKTGTTDKAGHCLCCTALRNKMCLIAVCLGAHKTNDIKGDEVRQEICKKLLDYGFSTYKIIQPKIDEHDVAPIVVQKGEKSFVNVKIESNAESILVKKNSKANLEKTVKLNNDVKAPIVKGQQMGEIVYSLNGSNVFTLPIVACENVNKISFSYLFMAIFKNFFAGINLT